MEKVGLCAVSRVSRVASGEADSKNIRAGEELPYGAVAALCLDSALQSEAVKYLLLLVLVG